MTTRFARADLFDASALVCLHVEEAGSAAVHEYFNRRATVYTTGFCFYEALSVLKTKWRRRSTGQITREQYFQAAHELTVWYAASSKTLPEVELIDGSAYGKVRELAVRHNLDYSDALQLVSVKFGRYSNLINESSTVLTTVDSGLARAARAEGIRVWSVLEGPAPE